MGGARGGAEQSGPARGGCAGWRTGVERGCDSAFGSTMAVARSASGTIKACTGEVVRLSGALFQRSTHWGELQRALGLVAATCGSEGHEAQWCAVGLAAEPATADPPCSMAQSGGQGRPSRHCQLASDAPLSATRDTAVRPASPRLVMCRSPRIITTLMLLRTWMFLLRYGNRVFLRGYGLDVADRTSATPFGVSSRNSPSSVTPTALPANPSPGPGER